MKHRQITWSSRWWKSSQKKWRCSMWESKKKWWLRWHWRKWMGKNGTGDLTSSIPSLKFTNLFPYNWFLIGQLHYKGILFPIPWQLPSFSPILFQAIQPKEENPASFANWSGVWRFRSTKFNRAPWERRIGMTSKKTIRAARCRGVSPLLFGVFMLAPALINALDTSIFVFT